MLAVFPLAAEELFVWQDELLPDGKLQIVLQIKDKCYIYAGSVQFDIISGGQKLAPEKAPHAVWDESSQMEIYPSGLWKWIFSGQAPYSGSVGYQGCSHSNLVSVSGANSSLSCSWMVIGSKDYVTFGNALNIEDGASVSVTTLDICGSNSVLRIDNAQLSSGQSQIASTDSNSGEAILEIAGANPLLYAEKTLRIRKKTAMRFELPAQAYSQAPLKSDGRIEIIGNSTLELSIPESIRQITRYTLVETTGTIDENSILYIEGGTYSGIVDSLPKEPYRCSLTKEARRLVLTVRPHFGTVISVR